MTVTSAGAQTRTTFGACLLATANQTPPSARLAPFTDSAFTTWADTWYRVAIPARTYPGNIGTYIQVFGVFYKLDSTNPYTTQPTLNNPPTGNLNYTSFSLAALAFLDANGNPIGYAWWNPQSGGFTTKSCYASAF